MNEDPHSPTTAAPEPVVAVPPLASPGPDHGPSSSLPIDPTERPEVLVGAAFAGGFVAAMILKRLGR